MEILITYINSSNDEYDQTIILKSIGKIPKKAPEISFADQKNDEFLEDNIYSEIGNEEEFLKKKVIFILGPTAIGKTEVGIEIAKSVKI